MDPAVSPSVYRGRSLSYPIQSQQPSTDGVDAELLQQSILSSINSNTQIHTTSSSNATASSCTPTVESPSSGARHTHTDAAGRSNSVSPITSSTTATQPQPIALAAGRITASGLTQQLKHQKWRGYSPITIRTGRGGSGDQTGTVGNANSHIDNGSDDEEGSSENTSPNGRDSPFISSKPPRRARHTSHSPRGRDSMTLGSSPRGRDGTMSGNAVLAGLPPPLTHTLSTASTASPSLATGGGSGGNSTRTSLSYANGEVLSPSSEVGTPDSGSGGTPGSSSRFLNSNRGGGMMDRRHSSSGAAIISGDYSRGSGGSSRGSRRRSEARQHANSFSTPGPIIVGTNNNSNSNATSTPTGLHHHHQQHHVGTPTSTSGLYSRRPTLTGSGASSLASPGIMADTPDSDAYLQLLHRLLQRPPPKEDVDIFKVDFCAANSNTAAAQTAVPPSAAAPAPTVVRSQPLAHRSLLASDGGLQLPAPASTTRTTPMESDSSSSTSPPSITSSSSYQELLQLAQSYRDELVLERFHRKQAQAQLQRRVSAIGVGVGGMILTQPSQPLSHSHPPSFHSSPAQPHAARLVAPSIFLEGVSPAASAASTPGQSASPAPLNVQTQVYQQQQHLQHQLSHSGNVSPNCQQQHSQQHQQQQSQSHPSSASASKTHSLSLPLGTPGLMSSSTPPPPNVPSTVQSSGGAGINSTASTSNAAAPFPLTPSHLELCLDLRNDEYEALVALFERFKHSSQTKFQGLYEYSRGLEELLQQQINQKQTVEISLKQTKEQLSQLQQEYSKVTASLDELTRTQFLLGHKYASISTLLADMPRQIELVDTFSRRILVLESEKGALYQSIHGPGGLTESHQAQVHTFQAELNEKQSELATSQRLVKTLQEQLAQQTQERSLTNNKAIEELKQMLELQKLASQAKLREANEKLQQVKKHSCALEKRVLELEITYLHGNGDGSGQGQGVSTSSSSSMSNNHSTGNNSASVTPTASARRINNPYNPATIAEEFLKPTGTGATHITTNSTSSTGGLSITTGSSGHSIVSTATGLLNNQPVTPTSSLAAALAQQQQQHQHQQSHSGPGSRRSSVPNVMIPGQVAGVASSAAAASGGQLGAPSRSLTQAILQQQSSTLAQPFSRSSATSPLPIVGSMSGAQQQSQGDSSTRIRSPYAVPEKSAPIPIGAPSPSFHRPRSSSRGLGGGSGLASVGGGVGGQHNTPPDWPVPVTTNGGLGLGGVTGVGGGSHSSAAFQALPNPVLSNGGTGMIITQINPHPMGGMVMPLHQVQQPVAMPLAMPSAQPHVHNSILLQQHHQSSLGAAIIPPHEQKHHSSRRQQSMRDMLGRAAGMGATGQLEINSSDDELLDQQFSPSPTKQFKNRIYSPPLA